MTWEQEKAKAIATAKARATKTGLTQYVGMRYDTRLYVSKLRPRQESLIAEVTA
jgi:hypothetical protein